MTFKTTMISWAMVALISLLIFNIGCEEKRETWKYPVVSKVFMHTPGQYSFLYLEANELKSFSVDGNCQAVFKIIPDAELGSPMRAEILKVIPAGGTDIYYVTIHVHGPSDIGGGGWNRGKFGRGSQAEVE